MKVNLLFIALVLFQLSGCSQKAEDGSITQVEVDQPHAFLNVGDMPQLKVKQIEVEAGVDIKLALTSKAGKTSDITIMGNPAESINIQDSFYTDFCKQKAFVVVVRQWINTYESGGWFYYNAVIDIKDGRLIKVIETGEDQVTANGKVVLLGQQNAIAALKSGKQAEEICAPSEYE